MDCSEDSYSDEFVSYSSDDEQQFTYRNLTYNSLTDKFIRFLFTPECFDYPNELTDNIREKLEPAPETTLPEFNKKTMVRTFLNPQWTWKESDYTIHCKKLILESLKIALNMHNVSLSKLIDKDGWTVLHWAIGDYSESIIDILLVAADDAKRLVITQDKIFKRTPLHAAADYGKTDDAILLLKAAEDQAGKLLKLKDVDGRTALMRATKNLTYYRKRPEIVAFLQATEDAYGQDENNEKLLEFLSKKWVWAGQNQ